MEHVRTSALGTQFDLALAMIFALGWSFLGSSLILALKGSLKKRLTRQRTRQTAMESGNNVG